MVKNLPESRRILDQPTHLKFAPPCQAVLFRATLHLPVTLKPDTGNWELPVCPRARPSSSNRQILSALTPSHPFLPTETTIKAPAQPSLPHSPCLLPDPSAPLGVSPPGYSCPLLSGMVSNTLSLPWQPSSDPLASPDPKDNKASILEQQCLCRTVAQSPIQKKHLSAVAWKGEALFLKFSKNAHLSAGQTGLENDDVVIVIFCLVARRPPSHGAVAGELISPLLPPPALTLHTYRTQSLKAGHL